MTASKIEWCDRSDWNPIRGCTRVSPGCGGPGPHGGCYAEAIAARFSDPGQAFHGYAERTASGPRWTGKVELQPNRLDLPLRWRKPARIFVSSTSDLFHEKLSDEDIDRIFAVMALAPQHQFLVLTKRAWRMRDWVCGEGGFIRPLARSGGAMVADQDRPLQWPLPNVWLGVSVEDQTRADERIPPLLETPASVRFISAEPLLGPINLGWSIERPAGSLGRLDWVIAGGESGPGARPWSIEWARELRDQCIAADVAFFWKQNGAWAPAGSGPTGEDGSFAFGDYKYDRTMRENVSEGRPRNFTIFGARSLMRRVGKKAAGRLLDGREWSEFPT